MNPIRLTTEEMAALLDRYPDMSPPTRHVLVTGQAVFTDADGNNYAAPLTHVDKNPTHRAVVKFDVKGPNQCSS